MAHGGEINIPTLLMGAKYDTMVSFDAIEEFALKSNPKVQYKSWNMFHELHNDFGRDEVFVYVRQYLDALLTSQHNVTA